MGQASQPLDQNTAKERDDDALEDAGSVGLY